MFETLYTYPAVLRRHREGPLAAERTAYLADLSAKSVARKTLLRQASCCLRVAAELQRWPPERCSTRQRYRRWRPGALAGTEARQVIGDLARNTFGSWRWALYAVSVDCVQTRRPCRITTTPCCPGLLPCGGRKGDGRPKLPAMRRDGRLRGSLMTSYSVAWFWKMSVQPISMHFTSTWRCGGAGTSLYLCEISSLMVPVLRDAGPCPV